MSSVIIQNKWWFTRKPASRVFLAPPEGLMKFLSSLYHAWQLLLAKFFDLVKLEFWPPGPPEPPAGQGSNLNSLFPALISLRSNLTETKLKLKLCIFVLSRVHLECTYMILVKSDPTKVIKAKLKALRLPKSRLCTIIFVFYAAFESVCIELQSLWDLSWLKVLKAKKATRNIQN